MTQASMNNETIQSNDIKDAQLEVLAMIPKFGTYSIIIGILLILTGCLGVLLPGVIAVEATLIIGATLLLGSIFWLVHIYNYKSYGWVQWLKPIILLITGCLMLFYPLRGVAFIGSLLLVYLVLDALSSFTFAYLLRPVKGWGWMIFNGVTSLALAVLFLMSWPEGTLIIIGLYISISLFFDGWALLYMGWMQRQLTKDQA
ncbi:HdeD family acid-resistance protein [Leucothrix arctica]|uniref:HdeD family acid-resistance protein n=1 Tax=Leucothrix arctica TaxID=1481894 RepID=A0A317C6M5_9GAMM|nr:DUF308 domain-containing protein [Leucothrix arctica]PWQ93851.1 hypothetical protein DKT75_19815 [Leucothrix arctica]